MLQDASFFSEAQNEQRSKKMKCLIKVIFQSKQYKFTYLHKAHVGRSAGCQALSISHVDCRNTFLPFEKNGKG